MMSTRRSLFTFGALLAAVALLAPATALAQSALAVGPTDPSSHDMLEVTWTRDDDAGTEGYRIYFQKQADDTTTTAPTTANHTGRMDVDGLATEEATLTGLDHDSYYRVAIAPIDGDDMVGDIVDQADTSAAGSAKTDVAGAPGPPRNVRAMGGDETFTVMWDAPYAGEAGLTIDHYRVQKREVAGNLFGDWVPDEGDDEGGKKVAGDMTMIVFEDLDNGIVYQARVMASNSADVAGPYSTLEDDMSDPGDEAATTGMGDDDDDDDEDMTETPALPIVGLLALGAGLLAAGRRRLRL